MLRLQRGRTGCVCSLIPSWVASRELARSLSSLSGDGATLVFEQETWFDGSYRRARVERTGEPDVFVLDSSAEQRTLREPLKEEAWWCLGDWRTDPILEGATDWPFRGIRSDAFSLHDIGLALRAACEAVASCGAPACERRHHAPRHGSGSQSAAREGDRFWVARQ